MRFIQELKELKDSILSWLLSFVIISFAIFTVGLNKIQIFGFDFLVPVFSQHSLAAIFFDSVRHDLLPEGVKLIATNPLSAFVSQITISLLLALILTFPFLLFKISGYLSPALYDGEKKAAVKIFVPSILLFFAGAFFAYFSLIPETFSVLYSFNAVIGAEPFFSVSEFIGWVFVLMFATGTMFLLPVFMYLLARLSLVGANFWKENWRGAFLVFLIVSAVITPDGSGVTMMLLSAPLAALYGLGIGLSGMSAGKSFPVHRRDLPRHGRGLPKRAVHERI